MVLLAGVGPDVDFIGRAVAICRRVVWSRSVVVDLAQVGQHRGMVWIMWSPRRAGGFHRCLRLRWRLPRFEHIEPAGVAARWTSRTSSAGWTGRTHEIHIARGWFEWSLRVDDNLHEWRIGRE